MNALAQKQEEVQVQPEKLKVLGEVIQGPGAQPEVNLGGYTQAQLETYLDFQLTGKSTATKYFDQKVSETNFSAEDRKRIQDARFMNRAMLAHPESKAAALADLRRKEVVLTRHRTNLAGNRQSLGFLDTSVELPKAPVKTQAEKDAAKAKRKQAAQAAKK